MKKISKAKPWMAWMSLGSFSAPERSALPLSTEGTKE